ncbi:MAG: isopentenyl phosphate kinase [Anaerolineae bacterium]|nr:isopentenyl phosphate kinase [Anaerolineae bacterium]MDW8071351.1 isopentenyl phosphate kinase [Anaerolineae bacterium]
MTQQVFLKLGGSVITDKQTPFTAREDVVRRIAREIVQAMRANPAMRLVIGHGSGSFGHVVAHRYRTHEGWRDVTSWRGFAETAHAAAQLNRLVVGWLLDEGVAAVSFQPSASALCRGRQLCVLAVEPLERALDAGLTPVVYGDVALDERQGFTIISTEQIFAYLAVHLRPARIVLAGMVDGVYERDPIRDPSARRIAWITPTEWEAVRTVLGASHAVDVTGGMVSKVQIMIELVQAHPELQVSIVSGAIPGRVRDALLGTLGAGTRISTGTPAV